MMMDDLGSVAFLTARIFFEYFLLIAYFKNLKISKKVRNFFLFKMIAYNYFKILK